MDVDGFVQAAGQLYSDPALRAAFGKNARNYAEKHFDIGAISESFERIFANVVESEISRIRLMKSRSVTGLTG